MILFITLVLSLVIFTVALLAVSTKTLTTSVIAAGAVSLFASLLYVILRAPDVAMTEAAISSGLMTALFFIILSRIGRKNDD